MADINKIVDGNGTAYNFRDSDAARNTPTFSQASSRDNLNGSGETMPTILGKIKKWFTDLKTVAFTGSYNDLSNKPTIPAAANNGKLTIQMNGVSKGDFTANASADKTIDLGTVITDVSGKANLDNASQYILQEPSQSDSSKYLVLLQQEIKKQSSGDIWVNSDLLIAIQSRHSGTGILEIGVQANNSSATETALSGHLFLHGTPNSQPRFQYIMQMYRKWDSAAGKYTVTVVVPCRDYNKFTVKSVLARNGLDCKRSLEYVTDLTTLGTLICTEKCAAVDGAKFSAASSRSNIASEDSFVTVLGKLAKWYNDFNSVVWDGNATIANSLMYSRTSNMEKASYFIGKTITTGTSSLNCGIILLVNWRRNAATIAGDALLRIGYDGCYINVFKNTTNNIPKIYTRVVADGSQYYIEVYADAGNYEPITFTCISGGDRFSLGIRQNSIPSDAIEVGKNLIAYENGSYPNMSVGNATRLIDYGSSSNETIKVGWRGTDVTGTPDAIAVYTTNNNERAIKDMTVTNVRKLMNGTSVGGPSNPVYVASDGTITPTGYVPNQGGTLNYRQYNLTDCIDNATDPVTGAFWGSKNGATISRDDRNPTTIHTTTGNNAFFPSNQVSGQASRGSGDAVWADVNVLLDSRGITETDVVTIALFIGGVARDLRTIPILPNYNDYVHVSLFGTCSVNITASTDFSIKLVAATQPIKVWSYTGNVKLMM